MKSSWVISIQKMFSQFNQSSKKIHSYQNFMGSMLILFIPILSKGLKIPALNNKDDLMDYEEIPNSSLPASTVTKLQDIVVTNSPSADELPEERNSVQGLINKNPAESSSIEASSSNLPGNNPNLLNLRDFDMHENHLTTARSILHLNEPPAATGKQATINANDVPPIMTEIPEITHFKAITVPPKAAKRIDTLIFNQIQENISEIRASLSKSEDVRGSSASSAGPPGTLNRSTGVQAGTSRCNLPLNFD